MPDSGRELEGVAEGLYLERDYSAAAVHYERAYAAYRSRGRHDGGGPGGARGGVDHGQRARRLGGAQGLVGSGPRDPGGSGRGPARARLGPDHPVHLGAGPQAQEASLRDAMAVGRRFRDPDIEFDALGYLGGLFILTDRVEEGLDLLDEMMAAVCADEMTEVTTVDGLFCGFFWACELVNDVPRAEQWMRAAADLMSRQARRRRVLPCALRRDPDRRRPLDGGGDGAPRGQQPLRAGHVDEARGRTHPPR